MAVHGCAMKAAAAAASEVSLCCRYKQALMQVSRQSKRATAICNTSLDNEHNWTHKAIRCASKLQMRESDRQSPCEIQATMSQCKVKRRSLCMQEAWSKFSTDAGKHVMSETLALHVGDEAILHRYARKATAQHAS